MVRRLMWLLALAVCAGGSTGPALRAGSEGPAGETAQRRSRIVRVAAASDVQFAMADLVRAFEASHADIDVVVAYGSSGTYHAQILRQAPFDLFLSADMLYPRDLIAKGMGAKDGAFLYAIGRIVLWVRQESPIDVERLGIQALKDRRIRHVAIANPLHAPYGRAAEAAMRHFGVADAVKGRLVFGENIAQAAQFVESGAADIGIIARSLAVAPAMRSKGRYWEVPADAHPLLEQGGLVLAAAKDPGAASLLRQFMTSAEGRAILTRYGFVLPRG